MSNKPAGSSDRTSEDSAGEDETWQCKTCGYINSEEHDPWRCANCWQGHRYLTGEDDDD